MLTDFAFAEVQARVNGCVAATIAGLAEIVTVAGCATALTVNVTFAVVDPLVLPAVIV
jgi:hypothetical protein